MENSYDFGYCFFFVDRISTDIKDVPGLSGHGGADFYCIGSFIEAIAVCINYINIFLDWTVCFERDNCEQRRMGTSGCLTTSEQAFSYIMGRTSSISMR